MKISFLNWLNTRRTAPSTTENVALRPGESLIAKPETVILRPGESLLLSALRRHVGPDGGFRLGNTVIVPPGKQPLWLDIQALPHSSRECPRRGRDIWGVGFGPPEVRIVIMRPGYPRAVVTEVSAEQLADVELLAAYLELAEGLAFTESSRGRNSALLAA